MKDAEIKLLRGQISALRTDLELIRAKALSLWGVERDISIDEALFTLGEIGGMAEKGLIADAFLQRATDRYMVEEETNE